MLDSNEILEDAINESFEISFEKGKDEVLMEIEVELEIIIFDKNCLECGNLF